MSARLQSAAVKSEIYSYTFDYRGRVSKSNLRSKSDINIGVSHGDDTIYILKTEFDTLSTEKDRQMSQLLIDLTVSFMEKGIPNITADWLPVKKSLEEPYAQLKISSPTEPKMEFKKELGHRSFWESLPFKENNKFYGNFRDEL